MLQVAVEELVNYYRSMKRLRTICWFAQTVISSQWCETAAHRSTAPENARKSRETSTAGESFFLIPQSLQVSYSSGNIYMFGFFFFGVYHLVTYQLLPLCFCRAFNFQRHNRKCHLLPFDRFTQGVQKQANTSFTLYEKKGGWSHCLKWSLSAVKSDTMSVTTPRWIYTGKLMLVPPQCLC